ncbi:MAG: hypothetical protein M1598_09235 [Actinobacteria bacterium]|nr:hypothetical protein [Actinomycetota bacterium]
MRRQRHRSDGRGKWFLLGIVSGILIFLALGTALAVLATRYGIRVELSADEVADLVKAQVSRQSREDIPKIVQRIKDDVPRMVSEEMKGKLSSASIKISDVVITLPPESTRELQQSVEQTVRTAVINILDGMNTDEVAEQMGENAHRMVRDSLNRELGRKKFVYSPFRWLSVPVTVAIK